MHNNVGVGLCVLVVYACMLLCTVQESMGQSTTTPTESIAPELDLNCTEIVRDKENCTLTVDHEGVCSCEKTGWWEKYGIIVKIAGCMLGAVVILLVRGLCFRHKASCFPKKKCNRTEAGAGAAPPQPDPYGSNAQSDPYASNYAS